MKSWKDLRILTQVFYNGTKSNTRSVIDGAAGGVFMEKGLLKDMIFFEQFIANQWNNVRAPIKKAGKHDVKSCSPIRIRLAALTRNIDRLQLGSSAPTPIHAIGTGLGISGVTCDTCGIAGLA